MFVALIISFIPLNNYNYLVEKEVKPIKTYYSVSDIFTDEYEEVIEDAPFITLPGCNPVETTMVYTPNNTEVEVFINPELSANEIDQYNQRGDDIVSTAVRVADSSRKYNCHSYAWYQQSPENPYWMDDPSAYYTDGSYFEVSAPYINDRICYFNKNGFNLHSGIVIDTYSGDSNGVCGIANLVKVESKWGRLGLYQHRGDQCPYTNSYGGSATSVKFYHRHDYSFEYANLGDTHIAYCICGESVTESHHYHYKKINTEYHMGTCDCGKSLTSKHVWRRITKNNSVNNIYDGNYNVNAVLTSVECMYCKVVKILQPGEQVPIVI